ncbi:MAG: urate hydroxylase PuuD [Deltaproteobacteria bacterium]|nr:urate hydroxylase PuuD [Deltaproteobacteria bacterium]
MELLQVLIRWVHIVAGITWIGLLYYFNWMNGHIVATMDGETKKKVVPELMPRVLYWFRWGAAYTWITGVLLLMLVFYHGGLMFEGDQDWHAGAFVMLAVTFLGVFIYDAVFKAIKAQQPLGAIIGFALACVAILGFVYIGHFGYRAYVIHLGALFGTCMAFNVWFRIWPAQQRIITATKNGQAPDPADPAMAGLRSKHNTYMSVPLVYAMVNAHTVTVGANCYFWLMGAVALGWVVVYLLYKKGAQVKGF